ncbi:MULTISPECIES: response regulator transcription factor [unclassified Microbacterium]|uniref:response regulator transcription factor n=1 Tax=unclassified Microbacterium TaxID=2609290 RepID=UPI003016E2B8
MAHVLVVEDDGDVAELVRTILANAGHSVDIAVDGRSGIVAAGAVHPDLVVLDWMMPGMTGVEVCRVLRQDGDFADTRIMMLTAKSAPDDVATAMAAGADDYVVKPFSPRDLRTRIAALLS